MKTITQDAGGLRAAQEVSTKAGEPAQGTTWSFSTLADAAKQLGELAGPALEAKAELKAELERLAAARTREDALVAELVAGSVEVKG